MKAALAALGLNAVWINASEVFRYFVFVRKMMRASFPAQLDVAPMDWAVFAVWGAWDSLLILFSTLVVWLWLERFGRSIQQAVLAGTMVWAGVFGILWLGLYNMNLAPIAVVFTALPLAWGELVVAAILVRWALLRFA